MTSNLREEKNLLKESEARLMAERDNLHHSQYSMSLLMNNMESIKNNLDKNDSETRMRYENKISDLTEQCSRLKTKIESNIDIKEAQNKISTLDEQLRVSKSEANATKKALGEMEKKYNDLLVQEKAKSVVVSPILSRIRSPMQTSPATTPKSTSMVSQTVREMQVQLEEEKAKTSSLQTSLNQAQTNIVNLKDLVEKQELQIKEFSETSEAAQNEIESLRKSLEKSENKLKEVEEMLKNADESEKALKELMDKRLMDLTKDLEERENELEETQKKLEDSKKIEEKACLEQQEQSRIALETQTKYEREVMYHAADLEALKTLKSKLANYNSEIEEVVHAKIKVEEELKEIKAAQEARIEKLENMNKEYSTRIEGLEEQNKKLLDEFTQLSDKMSSVQMKLSSGGAEGVNSSFSEDEARSSEQLLEIIKYLRKEKEIAYGKVDVTRAEVVRLECQVKLVEDQVKQLNKHLAEEREKNQASIESTGKYAEMMRKVHTLDALADSNRLLREEKENLKISLDAVNAKISSLQSQIEPLQGRIHEKEKMLDKIIAEKKSLED
ncbi:Nucleoprotein TPR [Armadillidium nasatum]|uniref:Nucleoprotein TPR n=1 Tax=Armadillidium nasatum TaxID=96803 RepID=A0A5N5TJS3_9CRUS|nr:Nucleoprotein TPR [Armadillidium nasatum]